MSVKAARAIAAVIAMMGITLHAETAWRSDVALWQQAQRVSVAKPRVLLHAGLSYAEVGQQPRACDLMRRVALSPLRASDEWGQTIQRAAILNIQAMGC